MTAQAAVARGYFSGSRQSNAYVAYVHAAEQAGRPIVHVTPGSYSSWVRWAAPSAWTDDKRVAEANRELFRHVAAWLSERGVRRARGFAGGWFGELRLPADLALECAALVAAWDWTVPVPER